METGNVPSAQKYQNWDDVFKNSQQMTFRPLNTGSIYSSLKPYTQKESLPKGYDHAIMKNYAVMVFYFRHPEKGDILVDSGFDRSFYENPPFGNLSAPYREYLESNNVKYTQKKDEDLMFHLKKHNINPSYTFLTHLHPDHTAGLPVLPDKCKICYGKLEDSPEYRQLLENHFKGKKNIHFLDANSGTAIAPFNKALDVFGDGSFWALSTPGHTIDHFAYLINTAPAPLLIVGDAELTKWGMENGVFMNTDHGEQGKTAVQNSAKIIRQFHIMYPHVQIWFSHDEQPITQ